MKINQEEEDTQQSNPEIKVVHFYKLDSQSSIYRYYRLFGCLAVLGVFVLLSYAIITLLQPDVEPLMNGVMQMQIESTSNNLLSNFQASKIQQASNQIINVQQSTIQQPKSLNIHPIYIWLGDLPEHHKKKFQRLNYQFRLIRDCDKLLAKMQDELLQKFNAQIYATVNLKSDICRSIALYYYGGLYLDVDTTVDLACYNNYLKDKRIFFEATPINTVDIFAIYSSKPYDPQLLEAIRSYNTFRSYNPNYTTFTTRINEKAKTIAKSGCITHVQQRAWKVDPPK